MTRQQSSEENPFETSNFRPHSLPTYFGGIAAHPPFSGQRFKPQMTPLDFDPFSSSRLQQFTPSESLLPPASEFANTLRFLGISEPFPLSRKLSQRLMELSALKFGWDGENAAASKPEAVAHTVGLILILQSALSEFKEPFVVPTISGFMQLEWHSGQRVLEFEATANGWSIIGYETKPRGERVYHEADTARFDVDKLLAAYHWFTGLELLWPII